MASALGLQAADTAKSTYFKFDAGVSLLQDLELDTAGMIQDFVGEVSAKFKTDPGVRVDIAGGYNFSESWAVELEAGFTWNGVKEMEVSALGLTEVTEWDADYFQIPIQANVIYRLPLQSKFKPYLGAGVGGVYSMISGEDDEGEEFDETDFGFALQGMAGVDYEINQNTKIGIGYKFLGVIEPDFGEGAQLENVYTHSILAVFNMSF